MIDVCNHKWITRYQISSNRFDCACAYCGEWDALSIKDFDKVYCLCGEEKVIEVPSISYVVSKSYSICDACNIDEYISSMIDSSIERQLNILQTMVNKETVAKLLSRAKYARHRKLMLL